MLTVRAGGGRTAPAPGAFSREPAAGRRIALWEGTPRWVGLMRATAPTLDWLRIGSRGPHAAHVEGTLDLRSCTPRSTPPGLHVERLFDETLVLVSTDAAQRDPDDRYVYVDWGPAFDLQHAASYPDLERTALTANIGWLAVQLVVANGGSCFLPSAWPRPRWPRAGCSWCRTAPATAPAYLVHPLDSDSPVLERAVAALREMAKDLA